MDISTLHPHNREAYQKIMQHFDEVHQRACVVHATGTGKSYIITAVTDRFERVLIVTTNMFVIDQVSDTIKAESPERTTEPVYKIYPALLQDMDNQVDCLHKYDLIVLDEFHHGGAERWGQAVTWILEQNPDAKVLGTSATAIRHSDNMRDMGEELFEGHVLSRLPLGEAWARKILMAPYYIMAVEDSEEFHNEFIKKIEESKLLEEKKHFYREMASHLKDNYEMEKNASEIIRKWLPADSRRIIVFSRNIEEAESNVSKVEGWMKKSGFDVDNIYMVHSQRPFEEKKAQMAAFQTDNFNGIKIMVAVDMLNEGVHIPRVDAVFFLRKTESPTIFLQQMGRCMGLYKEGGRRSVVFDFRNNVENTRRAEHTGSFFSDAAKDYDAWKDLEEDLDTQVIHEQKNTERVRENFPDGINYTMDYGIMMDRFNEEVKYQNDWGLLEYYVGIAEEYYKNYEKKIPYNKSRELYRCYDFLNRFWNDEKKRAERPDLVQRLLNSGWENRINYNIENDILENEMYFHENGKRLTHGKTYGRIANFLRKEYNYDKYPEFVKRLMNSGWNDFEKRKDILFDYITLNEKYYNKFGKRINSKNYRKEYDCIRDFLRDEKRRTKRPDIVNRLLNSGWSLNEKKRTTGDKDVLKEYALLNLSYYKKSGCRIPFHFKNNARDYLQRFWKDKEKRAERPDVVEILRRSGFEDKVDEDLPMKYALQNKEYFIKNGEKISSKGRYKKAYATLRRIMSDDVLKSKNKDVVNILKNSGWGIVKSDNLYDRAKNAENYFKKHGKKIQASGEYKKIYQSLQRFWKDKEKRAERPDIVKILLKSGFKN